jgi:hypothetical protein
MAFYFVLAVLGIPSSLVGLWQLAVYVHRGVTQIRRSLRQRAEAHALDAARPERPALGARGVARSYRDLARKALAAGWQIQRRAGHDAWTSPTGARVLVPSAPRGGPSPRFVAELRRAGLDFAA